MNLPLFFVSDIHLRLSPSEDEKTKRDQLIAFIDHVVDKEGTLFIVGDLFDFWFEYKFVMPKAYFDVLTALYRARLKGVDIFFVPGNHDFWFLDFMQKNIFSDISSDGYSIEVSGKKFEILHGDGLLSWDRSYRLLRGLLHSRIFVSLYRWLHPDIGYVIGRAISRSGRHHVHTQEYNDAVIGELKEFAGTYFQDGTDFVIMGHYHQVRKVDLGNGTLIVLGDWIRYRSFGYFDGRELSLNYWR
ncbi:MAG: UDP-2,3-diacylglucosamine diphosphatase [Fidelibacterota bacterium]